MTALRDWFERSRPSFSGDLRWDEPLAASTYYQIGGPADLLLTPRSIEDLKIIRALLRDTGAPHFVMGLGSNLLVSDRGFRGVVIRSHRYNLGIEALDSTRIRAGSSVPISMLLRKAITQGWDGLEFLAGVPGSVGGIVTMNAGTHLGETKDALLESEVFLLRGNEDIPRRYSGDDLRYSYRTHHYLPNDAFITSATLRVKPGDPKVIKSTIDGTLERRKKSQPVDQPSCGSVFKNPIESGLKSWQVMEKLGLRGKQIGQAQFSNLHSNFIVNLGGAKAQDVRALIELAKSRARDELGVTLHEEVKYLGEF